MTPLSPLWGLLRQGSYCTCEACWGMVWTVPCECETCWGNTAHTVLHFWGLLRHGPVRPVEARYGQYLWGLLKQGMELYLWGLPEARYGLYLWGLLMQGMEWTCEACWCKVGMDCTCEACWCKVWTVPVRPVDARYGMYLWGLLRQGMECTCEACWGKVWKCTCEACWGKVWTVSVRHIRCRQVGTVRELELFWLYCTSHTRNNKTFYFILFTFKYCQSDRVFFIFSNSTINFLICRFFVAPILPRQSDSNRGNPFWKSAPKCI
jgi:hypothetical protein